jgi:hypothetical protein
VSVPDAPLLDAVRAVLPPGAALDGGGGADARFRIDPATSRAGTRSTYTVYDLFQDGRCLVEWTYLPQLLTVLEGALHFAVARHARDCLFVHAGVVGWGGRAVLMPGRSMSGKSELVDALVRAGATYYSDEYAPIDAATRVHPYRKPIRLRGGGQRSPRLDSVEDAAFDREAMPPLPVGLIVITRFRTGARWAPRRVSPGSAMLELIDNTVLARLQPAWTLARLAPVASAAPALWSERGEAASTAAVVLARLESLPVPPASFAAPGRGSAGRTLIATEAP